MNYVFSNLFLMISDMLQEMHFMLFVIITISSKNKYGNSVSAEPQITFPGQSQTAGQAGGGQMAAQTTGQIPGQTPNTQRMSHLFVLIL